MKKTLVLLSGLCVAMGAYAQGTLNFSSFATGVNAPITNVNNTRIVLATGNYVADLYWSANTASPSDSLTAAGFNQAFSTLTLNGGGYFLGGAHTVTGGSGVVLAQVRAWDFSKGQTYAAARDAGGEFGWSQTFLITLAASPAPPPAMVGLTGFQLQIIPEPTTFALAGLGAAALLIFRRRK